MPATGPPPLQARPAGTRAAGKNPPQTGPASPGDPNRPAISQAVIKKRLQSLALLSQKHNCPNIFLNGPENRRYFSGYTPSDPMLVESSGFLLITPKRRILLTDSRYDLAARQEAPLFETVIYQGSLVKTLAETVDLTEGLWFEPRFLTVEKLAELRSVLKIQIQPLPFDPSVLRRVKAPAELALIQKALVITETAVGRLWRALRAGWTEGRAAWFLDQAFRELGAEGSAFETIVASGPQAALPHATPGAKVIQKGEMVVIDCGARYQGYAADITRTRCLGRPTAWQRQIYRVVREAQTRALAALGPDKTGAEVDQVARDWISQAGFGDFFGHGLGHGVGLAVHEGPNLSRLNQEKLPVGAVVTVEPGIYLPGRGGVRLEQMAVVTKGGCQVLNQDVNFYEF